MRLIAWRNQPNTPECTRRPHEVIRIHQSIPEDLPKTLECIQRPREIIRTHPNFHEHLFMYDNTRILLDPRLLNNLSSLLCLQMFPWKIFDALHPLLKSWTNIFFHYFPSNRSNSSAINHHNSQNDRSKSELFTLKWAYIRESQLYHVLTCKIPWNYSSTYKNKTVQKIYIIFNFFLYTYCVYSFFFPTHWKATFKTHMIFICHDGWSLRHLQNSRLCISTAGKWCLFYFFWITFGLNFFIFIFQADII